MTRDEIVQIAWDVGLFMRSHQSQDEPTKLERFAERIAAEKEAQMIREGYRKCAEGQRTTQFCGLLEEAVKAEREECAKVCEEIPLPEEAAALTHLPTIERCANTIRARGET